MTPVTPAKIMALGLRKGMLVAAGPCEVLRVNEDFRIKGEAAFGTLGGAVMSVDPTSEFYVVGWMN